MFRKNRTHDHGWKLAAQRHLLQALEILSGGMVRIEVFDTVTQEHITPPGYEGRKFTVKAVVVADAWRGISSPQTVTAAMTLGLHMESRPQGWRLFCGIEGFSDTPCFSFSVNTHPSERTSTYWAEFDYREVKYVQHVLPKVCVGPAQHNPAEKMIGHHLGDRQVIRPTT